MNYGTISDNDLASLRGMIDNGDPNDPTDMDIESRYARLGNNYLVALEVWSIRRNKIVTNPNFSVPGYSESWSAQLTAIDKELDRLRTDVITLGLVPMGHVGNIRLVRNCDSFFTRR